MDKENEADTSTNDLMTEKEASEYLRINIRQLYNWRISGLIPYIKIGKAIRYRKAAIDNALAKMTLGPAS